MGKESKPVSVADLVTRGSRGVLVDRGARVITVCHECVRILYSAGEINFVTTAVAEGAAWDHGDFYSPGHHVSVVKGESPTFLKETLAVNGKSQSEKTPFGVYFFTPA